MKPVLFAVSAEGLVNPTVTSTVLIIIALMHIGIAPAVSKLISPIGVYPSEAVTGTLKSADFQAPKFIVPLVLFILSKLCESPFCRQMIESYFYILCDARIYDPPVIPKHRFLADVGISVRHYNRDVHIAFRGIGNDCDIVLNGINTGILVGTSFQVTILRRYL